MARSKPKEIVFGWCLSNKHDQCRMKYGENIVCVCGCDNHGVTRTAQNKKYQAEADAIIARINSANKGSGATRADYTRTGNLVKLKPNLDADTIEELERRRRK